MSSPNPDQHASRVAARQARRGHAPRVAPVTVANWTPAQRALLEPLVQREQLYNVFATFANHADLYRDWLVFARHILRRNTLPARDREILMLRIGWRCQAEYEWAQHARIGKLAGLTDEDLQQIIAGPNAPGIDPHDALLLTAVDELHDDVCLSDTTWNALSATYSLEQMMDLVFTVGQYNLVSMALNTFGVQLDSGLEGFPEEA